MKTGIIGAGAMGSIFSYFFNEGGVETLFYEKDSSIVASLKNGLNVIAGEKSVTVKTGISGNAGILKDCGIVFLFVKTYSTEEAVKEIKDSIKGDAIVVTLQNGLYNKELIARYIPEERIVYGSTSIGATKVDPATVRLGGIGNVVIGGKDKKAIEAVEGLLEKSGIDVIVSDDPDTAIWKKAIINAGINPLGALLRVSNGMIVSNEYSLKLQEKLVRESVRVANASGIKLDADEMVETTRDVCEKTFANFCSMLQDVSAGRKTEIDNINGIIIEYGKRNSVDTSFNEAVYRLIKAGEARDDREKDGDG